MPKGKGYARKAANQTKKAARRAYSSQGLTKAAKSAGKAATMARSLRRESGAAITRKEYEALKKRKTRPSIKKRPKPKDGLKPRIRRKPKPKYGPKPRKRYRGRKLA